MAADTRALGTLSRWAARLRSDPGLGYLLLAVVLALAIYTPALGYGLVGYDDTLLIRDNWVLQQLSLDALRTVFVDLHSPRRYALSPEYLPVRDLSVMLDFLLWGERYAGFHLTQLLLYVAALAGWFFTFAAFGIDRRLSGLAILIWAVLPTHAESVAWLAERKGLLGLVFSGLAGVSYARFRGGRGAAWLVLAALAGVAAVWSKAHAAFALAGLGVLELASPHTRVSWRRSLAGLSLVAAAGLAAFMPVLHLATSTDIVGGESGSLAGRVERVLGVHGFYVRLASMTLDNAISYPISTQGPSVFDTSVGLASLVACGAVALAPRTRWFAPPLVLRAACGLWLVGWLPVSHLILPLQMVMVADRYLLVPSLGFALALACGICSIRPRALTLGAVALLVTVAAWRSVRSRDNFRDALSLWSAAVASNPNDGMAWSAYAEALAKQGRPADALAAVKRGLEHTDSARLELRHALLLLASGDREAGALAMRKAAEKGDPRAMSNLGLLLLEGQQLEEAASWARRGAEAMPMYAPAQRALGRVALAAGRAGEAFIAFERAFELAPADCDNRYNLALSELALGRLDEARIHAEPCSTHPEAGRKARQLIAEIARRTAPPPRSLPD